MRKIIWFNGTGESIADTKHLFSRLNKKNTLLFLDGTEELKTMSSITHYKNIAKGVDDTDIDKITKVLINKFNSGTTNKDET